MNAIQIQGNQVQVPGGYDFPQHSNQQKFNNQNKPAKRKAEPYTCTVCCIEVTSQDVLQSHMNGQKHAKKLRQLAVINDMFWFFYWITFWLIKNFYGKLKETQAIKPAQSNENAAPIVEVKSTPEVCESKAEPQELAEATSATQKSALQQLNELASFYKVKIHFKNSYIHSI